MAFQVTERQRRWLDALLVLGTVVVALILIGYLSQLFLYFGDDYETIWDGERTARTGCVDTKRLLADRVIAHYAPARERYLGLLADPKALDDVLAEGAERIRPIAEATMAEVREKMGLR